LRLASVALSFFASEFLSNCAARRVTTRPPARWRDGAYERPDGLPAGDPRAGSEDVRFMHPLPATRPALRVSEAWTLNGRQAFRRRKRCSHHRRSVDRIISAKNRKRGDVETAELNGRVVQLTDIVVERRARARQSAADIGDLRLQARQVRSEAGEVAHERVDIAQRRKCAGYIRADVRKKPGSPARICTERAGREVVRIELQRPWRQQVRKIPGQWQGIRQPRDLLKYRRGICDGAPDRLRGCGDGSQVALLTSSLRQ
jgi:hypothetical protein